jgi:threonine/homoserine/homoserine lactone efflux protein
MLTPAYEFNYIFTGFITALIGITPPGLLNMTAAKVNLKEGRNAIWFVFGQ